MKQQKQRKTPRTITKIALKKARKEFILRSISAFVSRSLIMIIPILFAQAVGGISNKDYEKAFIMSGILIVVFIVYRLFEIINTYFWHRLYNKLYREFTDVGLQNTHDNSLFSLSRINAGEYINIMNTDVAVIADFYCHLSIRAIRVFEFIIIIIYFFMTNVFFGYAGIIVSLIGFLILYLSSNQIQNLNQKRAYALDRKNSILHEVLLCIKEIKGFNIFKPIKTRALGTADNYVNTFLTQRVVEDAYRFGIVLLIEIFRLALFMYGIYLISQGKMELAVLLVIYNYYAQLIDNFSDFALININYRALKVSEARFNKILEYSRDINEGKKNNIECEGNVTFKNILYGYKNNPTLDNVSFNIKSGEITCIVGEENCGKNGVIDLLLKLNRQHTGDILIDETNINDFSSEEYSDLIALASSESTFFNVSIRENLSIIDGDFERIVRICKALDIHEYIVHLENGYDTLLTVDATNIDLNVKILLGIARALVKDGRILVFDEVFTLLNKKSIDNIMNIIKERKELYTIIILSKDPYILEQSDRIILLDGNKVVESSKHEILVKNNKLYKEIVNK